MPLWKNEREEHRQTHRAEHQATRPALPLLCFRYPLLLFFGNQADQQDRNDEKSEERDAECTQRIAQDPRHRESENPKAKKRGEGDAVPAQSFPEPRSAGEQIHRGDKGGRAMRRQTLVKRGVRPGTPSTFGAGRTEIQPLSMNYSGYAYLVGYMLVYFAVVGGIWIWRLNRRQERPPVGEKLLRAPGESLRKRIEAFDDRLLFHLVGSALIPLLVMVSGLWIIDHLSPSAHMWALGGVLLMLAAVLYFSARWLIRILAQRRDHYLRYYGERVLGETLEGLKAKGFRIFHDVPASEASPVFDIDHVVVGSTGIFAIETKTRRRQKARPGFEDHKIIFDGQQLVFPWGADFHGLNQARDHAVWLENWCVQLLGRRVPVIPILAFPGWWVEEHAISTVRVANPNQISTIVLRSGPVLTEEQIESLTRQLEARCRDVEF